MSKAKQIAEYLDGSFDFHPPYSGDFNIDLSNKVTEASNELRRLSELNAVLLNAVEEARNWHQGDAWQESTNPSEVAAWEEQMQNLDNVIKQAKEQQ
jgi:hypothetical protein